VRLTSYDIKSLSVIKEKLESDPGKHHFIADLGHQHGLSIPKLKFGFQKLYGVSPHKYLHDRRMRLALELLSDDHKKLFAIAKATGYRHLSTFVTAFKNYYGQTPGYYRNNNVGD